MQKATQLVTKLTNTIMPANLPKTFKVGVFKEAGKPLSFEERELKLPEDGEVRLSSMLLHHAALTLLGPGQSPSLRCLPL